MIHFSADELLSQQQYKFLSGSVVPRPIAWITTLANDGQTVNVAPFSFFSVASNVLPLLSVAIMRKNGHSKDTAQNLLDHGEGVVHIVDLSTGEAMNETAAPLPPHQSELERTDLTLTQSRSVAVPAIQEAKIRFEVTVHQHIPVKDDDENITTDLFLLRVEDFYFDETVFDEEKQYILPDALQPLARLSGNAYATIGELFQMIRPIE